MKSVSDEADLPGLLAHVGQYVADKQRELTAASQERDALVQEKKCLQLQLLVAKREKASQVANLQAEKTSLQVRLDHAAATIDAQAEQLRGVEQRQAEGQAAAEAAAASCRQEVAGLQARVQELEALCTQQAQQLGEVPALEQLLQQQVISLEHGQQAAQVAEEGQQQELAALKAERDQARDKYLRYKRQVQEQAQAYRVLKDKLRRTKREHEEVLHRIRREGQAGRHAGQQQLRGVDGCEAVGQPLLARTHSVASSAEGDSISDQLHLTVSDTGFQRLPSLSSTEVAVQLSTHSGQDGRRMASVDQAQAALGPPPLPLLRCSSVGGRSAAAAVLLLQRRLEPPPEAAPPSAKVWPVEEALQAVPPTNEAQVLGSDHEEEEDVDVTQALPPPAAAEVVCTQLPPLAQHQWCQQQPQQEQEQRQQEPWRQQRQGPAGDPGSGHTKRQMEAEPRAAHPEDSMAPPSLPSKRQAVSPLEAQGAPMPRQQQQQPEYDHDRPPLASSLGAAVDTVANESDAAAPRQPVNWGGHQPAQQAAGWLQQAAGWRGSRPLVQQQQQLLLRGSGWKQAVRDNMASHTAFEVGVPKAPSGYTGSRPSSATGNRPGSSGIPPLPLREANGSSRAGGSGNGTSGDAGYRYQAVVRKKAEREKLQGVECQQCKRFYAALESWGTIGQEQVRLACGHVQQANGAGSGGPSGTGGLNRVQLQQEGSRHRYIWKPPNTQEGFWDMDVTQKSPAKHPGEEAEQRMGQQLQQQACHQVFWQAEDCDEQQWQG